jgi:hypothetical protein
MEFMAEAFTVSASSLFTPVVELLLFRVPH